VNPGCIVKNLKCINNTNEEVPCLILLDSYKLANLHHKEEIARNIYAWLNALWRERYFLDGNLFDESTMPIFTPYVPQQKNSFDCGLFLCKYALAFKNLDNFELSYHSIKVRQEENLKLLHVQKPFRFDNKNGAIANFRKQLLDLLEGLRDIKNSDCIDISDSTVGSISNDDHSGFGIPPWVCSSNTIDTARAWAGKTIRSSTVKRRINDHDELSDDNFSAECEFSETNIEEEKEECPMLVVVECKVCKAAVQCGVICSGCNYRVHKDCSVWVASSSEMGSLFCQKCSSDGKRYSESRWKQYMKR
jgi:hypothetical protein